MGTVDNKQKTTVDDSSLKEAIEVQIAQLFVAFSEKLNFTFPR